MHAYFPFCRVIWCLETAGILLLFVANTCAQKLNYIISYNISHKRNTKMIFVILSEIISEYNCNIKGVDKGRPDLSFHIVRWRFGSTSGAI